MKTAIRILLILLLSNCTQRKTPIKTEHTGEVIPEFSMLLADSITNLNSRNISNIYPTVFIFISPKCPFCKAQIQDIIRHNQRLSNINFIIMTSSSFSELKSFSKHYQLFKYPNINVCYDYSGFFPNYFEIEGVPYIAIYGENKRLIETFYGQVDCNQILDVCKNRFL